jgi:hypothetical protein
MLWRFWAKHPSVHDLFAAFVGFHPGAADHVSSEEELLAFSLFAGGLGGLNG